MLMECCSMFLDILLIAFSVGFGFSYGAFVFYRVIDEDRDEFNRVRYKKYSGLSVMCLALMVLLYIYNSSLDFHFPLFSPNYDSIMWRSYFTLLLLLWSFSLVVSALARCTIQR